MILFKPYANDNSAMNVTWWAQEGLAILEESMVAAQVVFRDFETQLGRYGETVNTRKPAEFTAKRKVDTDAVTVQDASVTNISVTLNQWIHTSFMIYDGEQTKSFQDLTNLYLRPAMLSIARKIDLIVLGQVHRFYANAGGDLGLLTSTTAKASILETRQVMNVNKAPVDGRVMFLAPNSETQLLQLDLFIAANTVGDQGTALENAFLGRKLGFDFYMCQNVPSILNTQPTLLGAINLTAGYAKGTTGALVVDGFTGAVATGEWLIIEGDEVPYQITAHTETLGNTTGITLNRALRKAVVNNAVITVTQSAHLVNLVAGYAAGWSKPIAIDTGTIAPQVGQLCSFGDDTDVYCIIEASNTSILLDKPLAAALANNDPVRLGPGGDYNFAMVRNALMLVVRPLATVDPADGARSFVASYNGISMRVTMQYQANTQGTLVTCDLLCGIATLESADGAVMLG